MRPAARDVLAGPWRRRAVPVLAAAVLAAWPFGRHAVRMRDEARALDAVHEMRRAQEGFRAATGVGFATAIESLTDGCGNAPLSRALLADLDRSGYEVLLRPSASAQATGRDCHGRPVVDDYYLGVQPRGAQVAGQRAYGATSRGDVYVFFDGLAPAEPDMAGGGLATPSAALSAFKIP